MALPRPTQSSLPGVAVAVQSADQTEAARTGAPANGDALSEKTTILDTTLANIAQGVLMVDGAGSVVLINRRAIDLLELPPAFHVPPFSFDAMVAAQASSGEFDGAGTDLTPSVRSFIAAGGRVVSPHDPHASYERTRPNGLTLEVQTTPMANGGFVRTFTDVTHRKVLERRLQEREKDARTLAKIVQMTSNHVIISDTERRITWLNDAACAVAGCPREELLGRTVPEVFHHPGRTLDLGADAVSRVLAGASVRVEHERLAGDGRLLWVSQDLSPLHDDEGRVAGIVSVAVDITERRNMEQTLRENERFLSEISELAGIGGWSVDLGNGTVLWSPMLRRLFDVDETFDPAYPNFARFFVPEDADRLMQARARALATGEPWDMELRTITASGRELVLRCLGRLEHKDGVPVRLVGSCQDITDRKRQEAVIARHAQDLEHFAHMASHDLQEPLRKIATYSKLLVSAAMEGELEDARRFAEIVTASAERGRSIVSDLLRYAKLKDQAVERASVDLAGLVHEICRQVEVPATEPPTTLDIAVEPVRVLGDPGLIGQVIQNLVGNALKYRDRLRPNTVSVAGRLDETKGVVRVVVTDTGIGFDLAHKDLIFQPFARLVKQGQFSGSGIGLSIVQSIVERHGWSITVDSSPGAGSRFEIQIPPRDVQL